MVHDPFIGSTELKAAIRTAKGKGIADAPTISWVALLESCELGLTGEGRCAQRRLARLYRLLEGERIGEELRFAVIRAQQLGADRNTQWRRRSCRRKSGRERDRGKPGAVGQRTVA